MADQQRPLGVFESCGVPIEAHSLSSAAASLLDAASAGRPARFHLCNADVLARAARDEDYREVLATSHVNFPDGTPVVWTAHRVGLPEAQRVPGADLFLETVRRGVEVGATHYLYGSTQDVLDQLVEGLRSGAPDVDIVGTESPPFRELSDSEFDDLCRRIEASGAQIVWVGLGTPKQDLLMARLEQRVGVVTVAVGAAFDFLGGTKQRAPEWMQHLGLEWLHRLLDEPGRLWKRYLIGNTTYLVHARRTARLVDRDEVVISDFLAANQRTTDGGRKIVRALVLADLAVIGLSSVLAYLVRISLADAGIVGAFQNELPVAIAILPLWLSVLYGFGCYRPQLQNQSSEAFRRFLGATTVGVLLLGFSSFLFRLDLSRLFVGVTFVSVLTLGSLVRGAIRAYLKRARAAGRLRRRVLIVGADPDAIAVASAMAGDDHAGYEVVGFRQR